MHGLTHHKHMECQSQLLQDISTEENVSFLDTADPILHESLSQLVEGDFNARWQASKILKSYGAEVHEPLITIAQAHRNDPDLQVFIVGILGVNPTPSTLLALVNLLKRSTDEEVRESIILTLGQQGPSQVNELMSFAKQPDLQMPVLRALVQINHPSTLEGLLQFVDHDIGDIRATALEALGQFHSEFITANLLQGLTDPSSNVRAVCVKALGLRGTQEIDEAHITTISALLYDLNADVCHQTARTLGRFDHPLALEYLWQRLIEQPTPISLTKSLVQALGWSCHTTGLAYLSTLLSLVAEDSEDSKLRLPWPSELVMELIQVIANLEKDSPVDQIELQLTSLLGTDIVPFNEIQVQQRLIMAIARLGQVSSISPLINALKMEDDRIRFHIIAALKQIHAEQSHQQLLSRHQDSTLEPALKTGIAIALSEW